jgi:hypothetical protein
MQNSNRLGIWRYMGSLKTFEKKRELIKSTDSKKCTEKEAWKKKKVQSNAGLG